VIYNLRQLVSMGLYFESAFSLFAKKKTNQEIKMTFDSRDRNISFKVEKRDSNGFVTNNSIAEKKTFLPPNNEITSALMKVSSISWYPTSVEIFRQGFPSSEVFFVEEGTLKLSHNDYHGKHIIVGLRLPGSYLGVSAVLTETPHIVTATTLTTCSLRRIPAEHLLKIMMEDCETNWSLQTSLCNEINAQMGQVLKLGASCARERFEKLVLEVIGSKTDQSKSQNVKINLPLKFKEIADLIAVDATRRNH
jgi:CRP-like cAMP-binding protein